MEAHGLNPVLNVSDLQATFTWFEQWGWRKLWDFHTPPTFGAVGSGKAVIFLCQNGQGGRGRGANATTFQRKGDTQADQGVWMSVWVDDANAVYEQCRDAGLDITFPPTDMEWGARETHLRHPDGHVFRISQNLEEDE
jgi:catechol 2,3-dioxygenase-like lactoylglutathione lyase family enzyme